MAAARGNVAVGIDLGTTNTCVAVYKNGKVETIPNKMGEFVTPSWVTYTDQEVLIGKIAKDNAIRNIPGSVFGKYAVGIKKDYKLLNFQILIVAIKRIIGRKYNDPVVQKAIKNWKFKVVEDNSGIPKIEVVHINEKKQVYPEEISGLILREMKEVAEAYLEEKNITDAVITVPAYFNDHQRQATMDAAKIAGLNVLRLINEPTAAAIAYIYDKPEKKKRNILVYDLGGGTFDVSIVSLEGCNVKVKATRGDTNLGGINFDERCVSHFLKTIQEKYKINMDDIVETKCLKRLQNQVERAKHDLSSIVTTNIDLPSLYNGTDVYEEFSRARFDDLNEDLYARTLKIVEQCIKEAKLEKEDIDDIVLVGGSTRILKIEESLEEFFGKPISQAINKDHGVAHGAAVLAAKLNGTLPKELNILDVTSMSLGIETLHGEMNVLIKRNTQIPIQAQRVYTTGVDGENAIRIIVLEGDNRNAKKNAVLGFFDLLDLPADPSVNVTFMVDINGILTVNAIETSSGISKTMNVTLNKGRLGTKEIAVLRRHSNIIKEGNKEFNVVKDKRNEFESYLLKVKDDVRKKAYNINIREEQILINMLEEAFRWLSCQDAYDAKRIDNKYNIIRKYCANIKK